MVFALLNDLILISVCFLITYLLFRFFSSWSLALDVAVSHIIFLFPLVLIPYYFLAPFPNLLFKCSVGK